MLRQELAAQHVTLSVSDAGKLKYEAPASLPAALVEAMKVHRSELLASLQQVSSVPCLPPALARLVSAAASGQVRGGASLPSGLVTDLGEYVLAWAAAYLTGDRAYALSRLAEARAAWGQS